MGNYVTQLEISIERGGVWNATLLEGEAPETCEAILDVLLVTSESGHAVCPCSFLEFSLGCIRCRVTGGLFPRISLWLLGRLFSWLRMVMFWPVGLSVMGLPQWRGFDDGVLCLGVSDGGVVSYARVGADEGVGVDLAVVANYGGASYRCSAVDDLAFSDSHVVCYGCRIFDSSVVLLFEVIEDEQVCLEQVFRPPRVLSPALGLLDLYVGFL